MTMANSNGNGQAIALPSNNRVGQATAVEQSRAAAEVHAAILVAQQCPRDMQKALNIMEESCRQPELAERAFFRFPRGGQNVSGPSVHLAKELARCWGNLQYGVQELRRDDEHGQSEMQAFAWDVETNARNSTVFIVPHKRDKKDKMGNPSPEQLVDMRDIYENNANAGARRVRECIFGVLPPWFVQRAKNLCTETVKKGQGDKPLAQRISEAVASFERLGIKQDQLESKLERASAKWSAHDVAQLAVIYQSINNGEVSKESEFPPQRVTAEQITGNAQTAEPAQPADADDGNGYRDDDPDLFEAET